MLSLLDIAKRYNFRLMPCLTTPRRYKYRNNRQAKVTVDIVVEPEPQRVLVARLPNNEVIEIYEYDNNYLCVDIPWSQEALCKRLLKLKYEKVQDGDFELILKFPRSTASMKDLVALINTKMLCERSVASHCQPMGNTHSPSETKPVLLRTRLLTRSLVTEGLR